MIINTIQLIEKLPNGHSNSSQLSEILCIGWRSEAVDLRGTATVGSRLYQIVKGVGCRPNIVD
jgi:hypothetical protein